MCVCVCVCVCLCVCVVHKNVHVHDNACVYGCVHNLCVHTYVYEQNNEYKIKHHVRTLVSCSENPVSS